MIGQHVRLLQCPQNAELAELEVRLPEFMGAVGELAGDLATS
jgi:hypothetical protein